LNSPCARCKGFGERAFRTREANNRLRRVSLLALAQHLRGLLAEELNDVRLDANRYMAPKISWRVSRSSRQRGVLTLKISQRNALSLASLEPAQTAALATNLLDRRRWKKTAKFRWRVNLDRLLRVHT
jgi:hypothetical protein